MPVLRVIDPTDPSVSAAASRAGYCLFMEKTIRRFFVEKNIRRYSLEMEKRRASHTRDPSDPDDNVIIVGAVRVSLHLHEMTPAQKIAVLEYRRAIIYTILSLRKMNLPNEIISLIVLLVYGTRV